jgi:acetylornithine/succinyldiaminopimelate/putrescine aminotransferase/acyl-CoA synthetase (AMP-forming)/AMP-acid ligase II/predicted amino acid dehydrogenase/acyl carrier protein
MSGSRASAGIAERCATLVELLEARAADGIGKAGFRFIPDGGGAEQSLNLAELDARARGLAVRLAAEARPGDRAILYYPAGLDFLVALFACLRAGLVGVPVPSPRSRGGGLEEFAPIAAIIADCEPRLVLTTAAALAALPASGLQAPGAPRWLATDTLPAEGGAVSHVAGPDDLAYLQYTSGSTSAPKGVMVSHRNVMANLAAIFGRLAHREDAVGVAWLPHYHDMGLVGGQLSALYGGFPFVFMSPTAFLSRPLRWMRALSRYQGTWSGGPNFAYELCCRRVRSSELDELDLSRWRIAVNGSEPVRRATVERFCQTFAPAGFRPEAMSPFYGLAETVVFASGSRSDAPARMVLRGPVGKEEPAEQGWHASCGIASPGHGIAIVDPHMRTPTSPGEAGEIWVSGPSVARGYWGRPEESESVFRARLEGDDGLRWLRTGDCGFLDEGELIVTGRLKDLIIIGGANYAPQDIEATVEAAHPAVRAGNVIAFAVGGETDRLVIAAETVGDLDPRRASDVIAAVRSAVADRHGIAAGAVTLLRGRTLPKTSSGKLRRNATREAWLQGIKGVVAQWPPRPVPAAGPTQMPAPAADRLRGRLIDHVRRIVGDEAFPVDLSVPVHRLGLGSIELAELKAAIEAEFGREIPLARLLQGWTITDLMEELGAEVRTSNPDAGRHPYETIVNPAIGELLRRFRLDQPFVAGKGSWLTRADGSRVLDAIAGFGALPLGHNPDRIWNALAAARDRCEPSLVQPSMSEAAGELAERLLEVAPPGLAHVTFVNSGAEATEAALKIARAASGRSAFLSTCNGFHGKTLGALSVTGRASFQEPFGAPVFDVAYVPFGDAEALEAELRARGSSYAAFIVEPIQGEGGIVEPPAGYLAAAAEHCRRHGVKLVVDEIQTGLGRTGAMFACGEEGVVPDILLAGKALGGGIMPVGAVLYGPSCYSESFARGHSSTFAGNSLACRAGIAMLDCLAEEDGRLLREVAARGARLAARLRGVAAAHPEVLRCIRGRGYLLGLELSTERAGYGRDSLLGILAEQKSLAPLLASYLLNVEHLRVAPTLLSNHVVRIEPPLNFSDEEADLVVAGVARAVEHLARGDTAALVNHLLDHPAGTIPTPPARRERRVGGGGEREGDGRWAFLAHPVSAASYSQLDGSLACFADEQVAELADRLAGGLEPFVVGGARIETHAGAASGQFIVVPHDSLTLSREPRRSLATIREAAKLARDGGAGILGLGGYVSIASNGGAALASAGVPLTTGNSYTAIMAADAVEVACGKLGLPLEGATVGVVGGGGSVGQALSYLMAQRVGRLLLIGNPADREASLKRLRGAAEGIVGALLEEAGERPGELAARALDRCRRNGADASGVTNWLIAEGRLAATLSMEAALPDCDAVLIATSSPDLTVAPELLRHGALVCDVSQPRNIDARMLHGRPDVLVLDGGLVAVPGAPDLGWSFGLPAGIAFACMCEPMILALEGRYGAAPQQLGVPLDYLRALRRWGARHGFRSAEPRSFGRPIGDIDWQRLKAIRRGTRQATPPTEAVPAADRGRL